MITASPPVRAGYGRRALGELVYALTGFPLAMICFLLVLAPLLLGTVLAVTVVGLPVIAGGLWLARASGAVDRTMVRLLGRRVEPPALAARRPGLFGWTRARFTDGASWRAVAYRLLKIPLAAVAFVLALAFWGYGLGGLSYPLWRPLLPSQQDSHGGWHKGATLAGDYFLDTWPRVLGVAAAGALLFAIAPWVVRGPTMLDGLLVRVMMGRNGNEERIRELERSRSHAVDDAATRLRRIERDLHDGTQPQLVAVAMRLGMARDALEQESPELDLNRVRSLLETAHRGATDAIGDLRVLAQGIHPPILDSGLESALTTVAARSAVPVELTIDLPDRPSPAIETVLYFCATELLNNAAKHSRAGHVRADLTGRGGMVTLTVSDDGVGGAASGAGTGLVGLADRIQAFDGALRIDSPPGGPTTVTVELLDHA